VSNYLVRNRRQQLGGVHRLGPRQQLLRDFARGEIDCELLSQGLEIFVQARRCFPQAGFVCQLRLRE
jgi:hypothetical protein